MVRKRRKLTEFHTTLVAFTALFAVAVVLAFENDIIMKAGSDKAKEAFWLWAKQAGGSDRTYGSSVAVDDVGNAYVAGFLKGTADFDGQVVQQRSEMDILIVKYRRNGSIVWVKQFGDTGFSSAQSIAIGKDGNIYATGTISDGIRERVPGFARIGAFELNSNGGEDMFIICLNPSGEPLWTTQPGSEGEVCAEGIAVDREGNCYVTGYFTGRFGNTEVISRGKEDVFVAKYNHRGHLQWVRGAGGPAKDASKDIAVDQDGNCYVTGSFEKEAIFGGVKPSSNIDLNFFLAKYDTNGKLQWVRYASGSLKDSYCHGVAVDAQQNSYVTGAFTGEMVLGSTKLNSTPTNDPEAPEFEKYDDVFVAKYDPDGKPVWAVHGGGPRGDIGRDITVDTAGNIYATGTFIGNAAFGAVKLTSEEGVFVAKYNANGALQWVEQSTKPRRLSGWPQSSGTGIAINSRGDCYVTGFFDIAIQFGQIKLEGFNSRNMFVAKITPR